MSAVRPSARAARSRGQDREPRGSASNLKHRVARIITTDRAGRVIGTVTRNRMRHHGLRLDLTGTEFTPRVRAQIFWGIYESSETRMIKKFLRDSATVVELGSSLGVTTAHIASVMAPGGRLICIEANPNLLSGLRQRAARRASSLAIEVIHAAISDHCGQAQLNVASETVGSRLAENQTTRATIQVPALTLREVLKRNNVKDFDLVSDIEGAEAAFLLNDPNVLTHCRRAIMELHEATAHGTQASITDLIDAIHHAGFKLIARHGSVVALSR
jgi:FkbM family methyltransferase